MQCFAVERGEVANSRCDVDFHHPEYANLIRHIEALPDTALISEIIARPLISGFAAGKDNRAQSGEDSVPQIRPTQILLDGEIDMSDAYGIGVKNVSERDYLQSGEVLFNNTNSTLLVGKSAVFREPVAAICSNHVTPLRVREGIEPAFVEMVLNLLRQEGYFARLCTNFNNQAGINTATLASVRIPLPPASQREKLIDMMAAARAERKAKLAEADALLAGIDDFLLDALGITPSAEGPRRVFTVRRGDVAARIDARHYALREELSSSFPITQLGLLVKTEPDYGSSSRAVARTSPDEPRYIRITDFGDDGIEPGHKFVTADPIELGYKLEMGDILFARSGSVGKTYIHEDASESAIFAGYCIRFKFDEARVSPKFVYWWTKTSAYYRWVDAIQRPSVQANINKEEFKSCPIPLPDLADQERLITQLESVRRNARRLRAEAEAGWEGAKRWFEEELLGTSKQFGLQVPRGV